MSDKQTQLWKQAVAIYKEISELSVTQAISHVDSIHDLSYELKQAVITLVNSGKQASVYIEKNFSPHLVGHSVQELNYKVGDNLGEYHLLEELGKGGMSYVFKAKRNDVEPQKLVAIKVFSPKSYSPQLLEHFVSEQKILSELSHPNIVDMLHGGKTEEDTTYLVMDLIDEAQAVNQFCKKLNTNKKINYILQCAKALAYAHSNLVIHRDLKPDNILIDKEGVLKIVDFGIAKLIDKDIVGDKTTIMALTPSYASPEQINSEKISTKTDIFSLAVVAVELLCGKKFLPKDRLIKSCEKDEQAIEATLKKLTIDKDLKNILRQALAQDPNERYASMQSFADDLGNYLKNLPVNATSQSLLYRLGKFAKRRKALFLTSLTLLASLIVGLGVTLWQNKQIKLEAAKAQSVKQFMLDSFSQSNPDTHSGKIVTAKDILDSSVFKLESNNGLEDDVKFELLQSLAIAYDQLGLIEKAIILFKKSLDLKPHDPVSTAYLAQDLYDNQFDAELEQLLVEYDEKQFDDLPQAKFGLARAKFLIGKGKSKQALKILFRLEKLPGIQDNVNVLIGIIGTQAGSYYMLSDFQMAEKKLLSILEKFDLPQNHSVILSTQLDLGILYNAIGEYDKSLNIFLKIEPVFIQTMGDTYPDLGVLFLKMASDYLAKGELNKAQIYAQKCYDLYVSIHGKKGAQVARAINMLAVIHKKNHNVEKAISLLEEAIAILNKTFEVDYPLTLDLKKNLAVNYLAQGKTQIAYDMLKQVRTIQIQKLGNNNLATISTEVKLVLALTKQGNLAKAQELGEATLKKCRELLPPKNRLQKAIRLNLSKVYSKLKQPQKSLKLLLEIEKQNLIRKSDQNWINLYQNIADAYHAVGSDEMADKYFHHAINKNNEIYPSTHIAILKIKIQYALFLQSINRLDEVHEILSEVKKIAQEQNYSDTYLLKTIKKLEESSSKE